MHVWWNPLNDAVQINTWITCNIIIGITWFEMPRWIWQHKKCQETALMHFSLLFVTKQITKKWFKCATV